MRHNHTDPNESTINPDDRTWTDPNARRLASDADVNDEVEQQGRLRRAGSDPGLTTSGSWQDIKSRFVDDPKGAIAAAEQLVQQAVEARIRAVQDEASALCGRDRDLDDESSTEALRNRLIRYQQYCERMSDAAVH